MLNLRGSKPLEGCFYKTKLPVGPLEAVRPVILPSSDPAEATSADHSPIPLRIHRIVPCSALDDLLHFGAGILYLFGRYAGIDGVGLHNSAG